MVHYAYSFSVNQLRFEAHLGFYDEERAGLQPVEVSLRLYFEQAPDCTGDDHAHFIDYAALAGEIGAAIASREFRLIEFMAQELFTLTRRYVDAHGGESVKLWLKLTKCRPAVEYLQQGASFVLADLPPGASVVAQD